jgi:hypothetical protein
MTASFTWNLAVISLRPSSRDWGVEFIGRIIHNYSCSNTFPLASARQAGRREDVKWRGNHSPRSRCVYLLRRLQLQHARGECVPLQLSGDGGFRPTEGSANGPHQPPRTPQNADLVSFVLRQMRIGSHGILKILNNLADTKSAGVLHFASELREVPFLRH